jgi:hypothetical protein
MTTLCHSRLYPPVRYYEFGYYSFVEQQQPQNLSLAFLLLLLGLSQRTVFAWHNQVYPSFPLTEHLSLYEETHLKLFIGQPAVLVRIRVVEHLINVVVCYRHRKVTHQVPEIILR